jgi:hypothetical protein
VLDNFVCIRVDVDQEKDLAKQYAASAMPDLRLLAPDGKELRRLLGFSSPERLLKECNQVLDVLAGRPVAEKKSTASGRSVAVNDTTIRAAIGRGCDFLERQPAPTAAPAEGIAGLGDASLLALVCGGRSDSEATRALASSVLATPLTSTYQVAFRAMALCRLDAKLHRAQLEQCLAFLAKNQLADGSWSYGSDPSAAGDRSNSAYALLGIDACARAGLAIAPDIVQRAERTWRELQNADGGWGYRRDREAESYASMTESALASLVLCRRMSGHTVPDDPIIERGRAWLAAHASVEQNTGSAYQQGRLLYHLYALERAASLLDVDRVGTLDWYQAGATMLLGSQHDDGSWDDGADMPAANTCFAILFLVRATRQK